MIWNFNPTELTLFKRYDEVVAFMSALDYDRDFEPLVKSTFISYSSPEFDSVFADILALQKET